MAIPVPVIAFGRTPSGGPSDAMTPVVYLSSAGGEIRLRVTHVVLAEAVWVLGSFYGHERGAIADTLRSFVLADSVSVEQPDTALEALRVMADSNVAFVDAYVAATAHWNAGPVRCAPKAGCAIPLRSARGCSGSPPTSRRTRSAADVSLPSSLIRAGRLDTPVPRTTALWVSVSEHIDAISIDAMMPHMRTTVRLDPDLAQRLRKMARERGTSFREALNTALRAGLATRAVGAKPYKLPTRAMRLRPGIDLDRALDLAAALEDEELVHKLELRK